MKTSRIFRRAAEVLVKEKDWYPGACYAIRRGKSLELKKSYCNAMNEQKIFAEMYGKLQYNNTYWLGKRNEKNANRRIIALLLAAEILEDKGN